MRLSSLTPDEMRADASVRITSIGRLRSGPRIKGMAQKEQRWLHPSLIFRYALPG